MIGYLEGRIAFRAERFVLVEAGGVGYKVFVNPATLKKLSEKKEAKIFTHLHKREDALELYGFLSYPELEFFEILLQVPGVGPKSALQILNVAPIDTLKRAISSGELSYLTKVSGIGRRTAEKIMVELREKFGKQPPDVSLLKEEQDALEALESLGYSLSEAREALGRVPAAVQGTAGRVKEALKTISRAKEH